MGRQGKDLHSLICNLGPKTIGAWTMKPVEVGHFAPQTRRLHLAATGCTASSAQRLVLTRHGSGRRFLQKQRLLWRLHVCGELPQRLAESAAPRVEPRITPQSTQDLWEEKKRPQLKHQRHRQCCWCLLLRRRRAKARLRSPGICWRKTGVRHAWPGI